MSSVTLPPGELLALFERLHAARGLPEALGTLMDHVLVPRGVGRAVAVVAEGGELRGVACVGVAEEAARGFAVPADADHPVARALRDGKPRVARADGWGEPLGIERCAVLPLGGRGPEESAFAVLVASVGPSDPAWLPEAAELIHRGGASVFPWVEQAAALRRAEESERRSELLATVVDSLPDPVLVTDAANGTVLQNRRADALFATSDANNEGRRRAVEINNLLLGSFLTRSAAPDPAAAGRELNLVDPSEGADLLFEVLSTPVPASFDGEGVTLAILRDITDLKRAITQMEHQFQRERQARALSRREQDRLNLILENVGDPILVTDARSDVILMNRRAERLFELPADAQPASARGREVQANDTKFSSVVNDLALSPDSARSAEFHLTDPETGREFPAEVVSEKILDERGESNAIVSIVHDLTKAVENERLAGELAQLNQGLEERIESATEALAERNRRLEWQSHELERAYRLKSEFLATMSHELRTPINALLGYTALLQDRIYGDLAPRQEQALARMRVATTHLLELVNDILDLAKIEAGKMPIHPERVDLAVLIRELSETFEPMVRARGLDYAVELPSELPFLETDRTRVKQVLLNLLSNAVKFTPSGSIRVRAKNVESGVEVAVVDTGIGIPEEEIGTIFEDFRQLDQTATREYGGTGLGLSITEKLLGLLGGSIRVTSRAGEGSVFTFRLPVRAPPSSAA